MTDRTVTVRLQANVDQYNRSVGRAADQTRMLERNVGRAQGSMRHLHLASAAAGGLVGGALGAMVVSSVRAAASFDVTMRQIAVATNRPASAIAGLRQLALKMGQDTVFSAQDAGDAMLELAKGGLTEAQIRAGALASTLTLASAGGLQLGDAASYIVQGLSTFNLDASKSKDVAAALAGGANASTASVQDMGLALSQVGPGAKLAGLTLQETTAVLAAFAQNGIKGSDAGTSLKTMLARLVPQTTAQAKAMKHLGLNFIDAHGQFLSIDKIAQQLHDHLGKLSDSQRTHALNTIFGSDASRAAAILMKEGAKGVQEYTRATSDKTQADKLAKATTEGMAGALSQLSGSIDTAKLQLGTALAPLVTDLANHMTVWANDVTTDVIPALAHFIDGMEKGTGPGGEFVDFLGSLKDAGAATWHVVHPMFSFIADHPDLFTEIAKDAAILAVAMKGIGMVKSLPGLGGARGSGAGALGGAAGGVVPVYVTNMGHGFPGGGGGGMPPVGRIGLGATLGYVGTSVALAEATDRFSKFLIQDGRDRGGVSGKLETAAGQVEKFGNDISMAGTTVRAFKTIIGTKPTDKPKFTAATDAAAADRAADALSDPRIARRTQIAAQTFARQWADAGSTAGTEASRNLTSLLTGGMARAEGQAAVSSRRIDRSFHGAFGNALADLHTFAVTLAAIPRSIQIGIHYGIPAIKAPIGHHDPDMLPLRTSPTSTQGASLMTAAPATTTTTIGTSGGVHVQALNVYPRTASSGDIATSTVQSLREAAFLSGSG